MKKNLVLFFTIKEFEEVHLYKDVGLTPYYLCKEYNLNGKIVYSNEIKEELPKYFRTLELEEIKFIKFPNIIRKLDKFKVLENINFYKYLLKNAKKIDYLMFFHYGVDKIFLIHLYKYLNPKGKIYIKLDSDGKNIIKSGIKYNILNFLLKKYEKKVDLFSGETLTAIEEIKKSNPFGMIDLKKIVYIPNGFDEEYLVKNKIKVKNYQKKENLMITIGRLGTKQKNTELLLKVLENIDLKDWRILLIGPYTEEFKKEYDKFIQQNKEKKDRVLLTGNIRDKSKLYEYYNRAKVFVLTSRWESFGIVLTEALRFGNYIITTDVGGARDITDNGKLGSIVEIESSEQLRKEIEKVINGEIDLKKIYVEIIDKTIYRFDWSYLVKGIEFFK